MNHGVRITDKHGLLHLRPKKKKNPQLRSQYQRLFVASHISGDGFPDATSSPPMMTEKDSFHPIIGKYWKRISDIKNTKNDILAAC